MDRGGLVKRDLNAGFVKTDSIITHFTLPPVQILVMQQFNTIPSSENRPFSIGNSHS